MRFILRFGTLVIIAALCQCAQGQNPDSKNAPLSEIRGIPPRATPGDYQSHAAAGKVTIAAEFLGHAIPRENGTTYTSEDYVVVETALFGPPGERLTISVGDYSLRINDKKAPLPGQPFGMVFRSLKDPEWAPPVPAESKSKTSFGSGGQGGQSDPPAPVHMPLELTRAMQQRVEKVALPEGDRPLPRAGLIFFPYRGKVESIHSIELTYAGPVGKATLTLQP